MGGRKGYRQTAKPCKKCGSLDRRRDRDGRSLGCAPCHKVNSRERMAVWRKANPGINAERTRKFRETRPDVARKNEFVARCKRFGITPEQYTEMLLKQEGVCAICRGHNASGKALAIDHDHATGQVRSLLCTLCNTGLGAFRDEPGRLRLAAEYLERYGK